MNNIQLSILAQLTHDRIDALIQSKRDENDSQGNLFGKGDD